jgi:hypothetical protein
MDRRRSRARQGGQAAAETNRFPLRRVVSETHRELVATADSGHFARDITVPAVLLECGHLVRPARDMVGDRHPARRGCRKCAEGLPRDVEEMTTP